MSPIRPIRAVPALLMVTLSAWACGDSTVDPDPDVAELVGLWDASAMVFTSVSDPDVQIDAIDFGATFFLDVQPSGSYTSSLSYQGLTATELGHLELSGGRLIFVVEIAPTGPRVDTASYDVTGDRLTLEGRTIFDFNLDGIGEAAHLEGTLHREP